MSSSNKHWPSMFKSKPCNTHHHHQWQHDVNPSSLLSPGCHRSTYSSVPGSEERTPEPKPRWNPKPEQIRILESIFNSGMVNPARDEIRRIRCQLQEFGQVGDANVFYWFQNRKSRSKHKHQRHLQTSTITSNRHQQKSTTTTPSAGTIATAPSPSTSSSEKSSPTKSVNNIYYHNSTPHQGQAEPFCFPATTAAVFSQGFGFPPELSGGVLNLGQGGDQTDWSWSGMLLSELMMMKKVEEERMNYTRVPTATPPASAASTATSCATDQVFPNTTAVSVPSTINHILGTGVGYSAAVGPDKSTVFINDVAFEVDVGPLNVREAFGHDAVLIYSSGHPVLTNEWGVTLQPLHHGGFYYMVRTLTPISTEENTTHMI